MGNKNWWRVSVNVQFFPCKKPVISDLLLGLCQFSSLEFGLPRLSFAVFLTKTKTELF